MFGGLQSLNALFTHFVGLLTVSSTTLVAVFLVGSTLVYPSGYPDPFAPYDALQPGKSLDAPEPFLAGCLDRPVCHIQPHDGHIRLIVVTADHRRVIQKVEFTVGELQVVDLVKHWGHPDSIERGQARYLLHWNLGVYAYVPRATHFTYQLPVSFVELIVPF